MATDFLDPEAPDDRPQWKPVYMGEGQNRRCANCSQLVERHDEDGFELFCFESYLRVQDGNR